MATVVNTTQPARSESGMSYLLPAILLIALVLGLLYYGGALARGLSRSTSPSVTVPEQIDVNVNPGTDNTGSNGQ